MKGEHAGFCAKASQYQGAGQVKPAAVYCADCLCQLTESECSDFYVQQHKAHQHGHTAQDGNGKVGLPGPHRFGCLFLDNPAIAGKG